MKSFAIKRLLSEQMLNFLPIFVLFIFIISCANTNKPTNRPDNASPANFSPDRATNQSKAVQGFPTEGICSLPSQVADSTPFSNLGGGTWGRWDESNAELSYGCNGGKDSIKLKDDGDVDIVAEFGAIGGEKSAHYLSAEYMAMQYTKVNPEEKTFRNQYADFCDKLSGKLYGQKLPTTFRKRLLDESTYSSSGTANEYSEKVGNGYVNLSSNKNKTTMIMLDVHFFSSEEEYKKYKDS